MKKEPVKIGNFDDFKKEYQNKKIYWRNGFVPSDCLEAYLPYYINFVNGYSKEKLDEDIKNDIDKNIISVSKTSCFYYPNTNMFSADNSQYGISGYILRFK